MNLRSLRLAVLALALAAFVGCDTNPGGPSAPTTPAGGNIPAPSTTPGVMPKPGQGRPPTTPTPTKPD